MTAATLHEIADRLERLAPSHRDPFRFHEEKSELVAELRRLAGMRGFTHTPANANRYDGDLLWWSHHRIAGGATARTNGWAKNALRASVKSVKTMMVSLE